MYEIKDVKKMMETIAQEASKHVDLLAELDGRSGDGDLGETVEKLAKVIIEGSRRDYDDIGMMLKTVAAEMNRAAPSTLGTLLSMGVMALAKSCRGRSTLDAEDVAGFPYILAESIGKSGKAKPGDKTILDALYPMAETVKSTFSETGDLRASYRAGAQAAEQGAESTAGMMPKAGRAQWIGERVKENKDAGAVLCAKTAEVFLRF